jgi:hypothetical protein
MVYRVADRKRLDEDEVFNWPIAKLRMWDEYYAREESEEMKAARFISSWFINAHRREGSPITLPDDLRPTKEIKNQTLEEIGAALRSIK